MTAPTNSDAETTPSRAVVVSDACSGIERAIAAARASMRANEAEDVAREAYYKDPELCRYAVEEMKRERVEAKRLFSEANHITTQVGP